MKFKHRVLVRDFEDLNKYEIVELNLSFTELMAADSESILNFCASTIIIWVFICLMFASVLGFVYVLKTNF